MTTPDDSDPQRDPQDGAHDDGAGAAQGDGVRGARGEDAGAGAGAGRADEARGAGAGEGGVPGAGSDGASERGVSAGPDGSAESGVAAGSDVSSGPDDHAGPDAHSAPEDPVPSARAGSESSAGAGADSSSAGPDRVYRSGAGIAGGVLLLALIGWLGIDALVRGHGHAPWLALATMLALVPLVLAFTLRPAAFANNDRLRIRNPFRTITLPWASVTALRSGYSNEAVAESGRKYQLWAIPVSLRARKKAGRTQLRASAAESRRGGSPFGGPRVKSISGTFGGSGSRRPDRTADAGPVRAPADRAMDDLRELAETRAEAPGSQGAPEVRWCYEIMVPAGAGIVLLAVLLGVG